jgi:hypothetical protein
MTNLFIDPRDHWAAFKRWLFNRPIIRDPKTPREGLQNLSRNLYGDDRLLPKSPAP